MLVSANRVFVVQRHGTDPEARARLVHTADVLAAVGHGATEQLLALEDDGTRTTLVTAYAGGRSLAHTVPHRTRDLAAVATRLLGTLAALHAVGVTHGPVEPSHVRFRYDRVPVLCDFSLGRRHPTGDRAAWAAERHTDIRSVGVLLEGLLRRTDTRRVHGPVDRLVRRHLARTAVRITTGGFDDALDAAGAVARSGSIGHIVAGPSK